eukprot:UN12059
MSFEKVWRDKNRLAWYLFAMSILFVGVLGLRGAECYENKATAYKGYGIYISDLTMYWQTEDSDMFYPNNQYSQAYDNLNHIRVRLRHSKSAQPGKDVYVRLGRTHQAIDLKDIFFRHQVRIVH